MICIAADLAVADIHTKFSLHLSIVSCRDRQKCIARFHQALSELQRSPLLTRAALCVTAAEDLAGDELMAVATAANEAIIALEQRMQDHPTNNGWNSECHITTDNLACKRGCKMK